MSNHKVLRTDYEHDRQVCVTLGELDPAYLYIERLKIPGGTPASFAVDRLVKVVAVDDEHGIVPTIELSDDGEELSGSLREELVADNGIIWQRNAQDPEQGYFLRCSGSLEDELQALEESMLVPVVMRFGFTHEQDDFRRQ